jgi:hypothetical protein
MKYTDVYGAYIHGISDKETQNIRSYTVHIYAVFLAGKK